MKILDKIGLVLFSIIVLVISLTLCIIISGWLDLQIIIDGLEYLVTTEVPAKVTAGIALALIILALKCIFFNTNEKNNLSVKEGILLENENGKLLVSKDTIESLTNSVVKNFETAETVMTKVELDEENNVRIYITLSVHPDAVIKELTTKLQNDIKSAVKKSLDLDVKAVNVRIKNINVKKENIVKE